MENININFVGFDGLLYKMATWTENTSMKEFSDSGKLNVICSGRIIGIKPSYAWIIREDNHKIVCRDLEDLTILPT